VVDGTTTTYVYDLQYQAIEERAGDGNLAARYTYGAGIDEPLTLERDGKTYTYHRDALGSITEITDGMGALVERYAYDVYGEPQFLDDAGNPLAASAIGNPYLFTARRYDPESGNYDYRTRIYSPWTGRFLQIDPLGYADGLNRYRYGLNRPPSVIDPMGTLAWVKDISCEGTIVPEGLHWKATAQFSFLLDDEQCTMSKQAGPIYGGLHIAPPNSLLAVGDWATQRKITKKCCLKPGKTSGKKGRRCRRPNRCRRRGTEAKLVWTYRIRLYTSIGFRQYGYQRLQRTCYIPIHLTCQCKRGK
jgi:RHS repeat-associated protein